MINETPDETLSAAAPAADARAQKLAALIAEFARNAHAAASPAGEDLWNALHALAPALAADIVALFKE